MGESYLAWHMRMARGKFVLYGTAWLTHYAQDLRIGSGFGATEINGSFGDGTGVEIGRETQKT